MLSSVSILITTFLRDGSLDRCLATLQQHFADARLIVVDDGDSTAPKQALYVRLREQGHTVIECGFDTGLAEKRNLGVAACQTPFLLMGCDDFVFDASARAGVEKLLAVLEQNPDIALASGRVDNHPYEGFLEYVPGQYIKEHRLQPDGAQPFYKVDLTVNYFLARVDLICDVLWDARMKIGGEHGDWFLELKQRGRTVVWVPGVSIGHAHNDAGNDPRYRNFRGRARSLGHQVFLQKRGVRRHFGFDGAVIKPQILIAVVTCHANAERVERLRETWLQDVPESVDCRLFYGRGGEREPLLDEVFLDVRDDYAGLPEKAKGIYAWSIEHGYRWTFKVDDDTHVFVRRLLSEILVSDYVGRLNHCFGGFASGGPGFWLSRRAAQIVAAEPLSAETADDKWIGLVLQKHGIHCQASKRYVLDIDSFNPMAVASICQVPRAPAKTPNPRPAVLPPSPPPREPPAACAHEAQPITVEIEIENLGGLMRPIKTFWVDCGNNWGDLFSRNAFHRLFGIELVKTDPTEAELFCTGSILLKMPMEYTGHVLGSGAWDWKPNGAPFDARNVNVWLLRGRMTREHYLCRDEPLLGDPGLLAHIWRKPHINPQYEVGVIPHYVDKLRPEVTLWRGKGAHIINIQASFQEVIDETCKCARVVSSSLHGLILCDALGIPNQWVGWDRRVVDRGSETFKFNDYYSVYDDGFQPHVFDKIADALPHCITRDTAKVKADVALAFRRFVLAMKQEEARAQAEGVPA